jgi:hypothetical protein
MDCGCAPIDVLVSGFVGGIAAVAVVVGLVVAWAGGPKRWWQ